MTVLTDQCAGRPDERVCKILAEVACEAPGVVIVDLGAVGLNWQALRGLVSPARCGAVVKADAYGLGAKRVIPTLLEAGCETFFVATLDEAVEARGLAPGAEFYLLDGLMPGMARAVLESGAWPVLSSLEEAREWANVAAGVGPDASLPCALHLDTGLNRLGFEARDLRALAGDMHLLAKLDVKLVMSHMACADDPQHPMNETQLMVFKQLGPLVPSVPASLAASDGLMLGPDYHFDLVRPGYALYGGQAFAQKRTPVSPVVSAYARVIQVHDCAPGHTVGYSATYRVERQSRVAVLALGYGDGFARGASVSSQSSQGRDDGNAETVCAPRVAFNGRFAPVIGRVSMDLITVDVTDIEEAPVERGDWAEVIGPNISLEEVGAGAQTIGYEILTRLGSRFHRVYVDLGSTSKSGA